MPVLDCLRSSVCCFASRAFRTEILHICLFDGFLLELFCSVFTFHVQRHCTMHIHIIFYCLARKVTIYRVSALLAYFRQPNAS
jgi:hypothetical protein